MPYEKRAEDRNTRDIAVMADTKVENHMIDCIEVRRRMEKTLGDIQSDIKRVLYILGGLVVASHLINHVWK